MSDPLLAQSAVDRLKSAAYELVVDGESYRDHQRPVVPPPTEPERAEPQGHLRALVPGQRLAELVRQRADHLCDRRGRAMEHYRPSTVTETMSIGALATGTGTPISTLRFYERTGLLGEPPRVSGQRRYPPEAAQRVAMIRMWRRAGFSVTEIRTLLADRHRLDDWQNLVRTKIAELEAHVAQMERSRTELQHALFCRAEDWTTCSWMKAAARSPVEPPP